MLSCRTSLRRSHPGASHARVFRAHGDVAAAWLELHLRHAVSPSAPRNEWIVMRNRASKPLTLDDVMTIGGLPAGEAYGADHAPVYDQAEANRLYLEAGETLRAGASARDGLQLLTVLAAIEHATSLEEPPQRVGIAMVELAQALVLQFPFAGAPVDPPAADRFIDALAADFHLFFDQTAKPPVDERGELLTRRRLQTLMVRHTFYAHHASTIFRRIADELKTVGHAVLGISLAEASLVSMAAAYWVSATLAGSDLAQEIASWQRGERAFDPAWSALFEVHPDILSVAMPSIAVDRIGAVLDRLSHEPGALASTDPAHLHLDNPVWRRPFVKHDGRWFCFSPGTLFSSQLDVLAELAGAISSRPGELLGKARGDALEDMVPTTLTAMFPHGRLLRSVFWDDAKGKEFETDAILLIDGILLIFESKADALSLTGRRGSNKWLKDFDDIVVEASLQAWRLEQTLRDTSISTIELRAADGTVTLNKADIRHIVRFGMSLERVTMASYGIENHLRERIERAGGKPMPIFTIGDLWQVRDLVGSEGRCLHFLLRRAELERDLEFLGDELDLIAHYLRTGFVRLWNEPRPEAASFYGLSDLLRHYQKGTPHYRADVKPPRRTTAWWDKLILEAETKQRPGWTDMVYDLLNIPLSSQQRFEEDIKTIRRKVRRMRGKRVHDGLLMQAPHQLRPSAFACLATGKMTSAERIATARSVFADLLDAHPDERLFVFVLDADLASHIPALPYYRGIAWDREIPPIETQGEGVASGLYVEIDRAPPDAET
jgi:hypothetical protein